MTPNQQQLRLFFETAIIFLIAVLSATLFASLWAKVFFDSWLAISFQNEVPNMLIFSTVLTALVVAWRSQISGKARLFILAGLALIAMEVFLELPLKKYVALIPSTPIRSWFVLFGMTEFIGMILTLIGVTTLIRGLRRKS